MLKFFVLILNWLNKDFRWYDFLYLAGWQLQAGDLAENWTGENLTGLVRPEDVELLASNFGFNLSTYI